MKKKKILQFRIIESQTSFKEVQNSRQGLLEIWKKVCNLETFPTVSTAVPCSVPGSVLSDWNFYRNQTIRVQGDLDSIHNEKILAS